MRNTRSSIEKKGPAGASALLLISAFSTPVRAQDSARPPPVNVEYLQYGVSLHSLTLLESGEVCPAGATTPCIIGSGTGLGLRVGYRARGPLYLGASYQLSRLDSSNLFRLAILQQVRAEGRFYFERGTRLTPYIEASAGGAWYGNEWGANTFGPNGGLGAGFEYQITATTVVGLFPNYQALALHRFSDTTGLTRADGALGFGLSHFLGVDLRIEMRDPLSRW